MNAITIRKLPDGAKQRLRMRAAANGRSMEAEARDILLGALDQPTKVDLSWIETLMVGAVDYDPVAGVQLDVPREELAVAPDFEEHHRAGGQG